MSGADSAGAISLRRRVYLLMAIGSFFPLVMMGAVGLFWMKALDERLLAGRISAASAVAAHFDAELTDDLEALQRVGHAVGAALVNQDGAAVKRALRDAHPQFRHRDVMFVLDRRRTLVADEPPGILADGGREAASLVEEVLANGRPRLSGTFPGARGAVVYELVPIRGWSGEVVGVAGATFRPDRRDFERMLRHLQRGQTGFADLLDGEGRIVASTAIARAGNRSECARRFVQLAKEKKPLSTRCNRCHSQHGVMNTPEEHLTFAPVGSAPWGVVVRQSLSEALPTEGALPWYAIVALLVGQVLLAGAFAWGAARSVTRPVEVLTDHAERISGGELAWPIPALGEDEVGRLGKSLEKMRRNIAEVNARLEQRVEERTRELNAANAQLREREEARSHLLRKVITAQEDERKRIARELHDETSQGLAVLAMGVEAAQDALRSGKVPHLDEVKALAVRTLEDVHRLILDLRPSVLDDLGLLSAIRWYAERHLETRGIAVRCEFGEMPRLPAEMETALFRMCQETMSNIARHAQATAVLVQVGIEGGDVLIDIEDDGKGFDPEAAARREGRRPWGLLGLRERAEILGGVARIESAPGQGTHVSVRIPVPRDPPSLPAQAGREGRGEGSEDGGAIADRSQERERT